MEPTSDSRTGIPHERVAIFFGLLAETARETFATTMCKSLSDPRGASIGELVTRVRTSNRSLEMTQRKVEAMLDSLQKLGCLSVEAGRYDLTPAAIAAAESVVALPKTMRYSLSYPACLSVFLGVCMQESHSLLEKFKASWLSDISPIESSADLGRVLGLDRGQSNLVRQHLIQEVPLLQSVGEPGTASRLYKLQWSAAGLERPERFVPPETIVAAIYLVYEALAVQLQAL
ncbi:MAG TPA: hypothetical protein VNG90_01015 [Candidatus Acidoferrum sp.]|nr:hypothetical protein [Candidatus Acidoferrum sp.]